MPKDDKIEVIRCKDCVYYIGNEYSNKNGSVINDNI